VPRAASTRSTTSHRQQGDTEWKHFDDTVYGGDFLQHQPPVKEMCDWAPRIIDLMDRLGVTFNRTPEGYRDQRRFGGTLYKRTAFAGATTGQQLIYALDEQVRRWEAEGRVKTYEYHDFLAPVLDDNGVCRGAIVQNLFTMEILALPAGAVVLATGVAMASIFGRSTMSTICTGGAVGSRIPRRREIWQRRVHAGPPHRHPRAPTSCAS
jgi:succinate dehydrogenase / fumarate reductase flavoprotein subunit